ncbi:MAG: type II secretion system protein GspE, partial [Pseudomonadales bacterium]|nr:type II secretion system protein GspE [Pseudomonadales bacterium]
LGLGEHVGHSMFKPVGCKRCNNSGYRGRRGIYEIVSVDSNIRRMIHDKVPEDVMIKEARLTGRSILDDGKEKVLEGITTVEEILRVTQEG